jgi:hypothetical protein
MWCAWAWVGSWGLWEVGSWTSKLDLEYLEPGAWSDLCVWLCAAKTTIARQDLSPGPFKILEQPSVRV